MTITTTIHNGSDVLVTCADCGETARYQFTDDDARDSPASPSLDALDVQWAIGDFAAVHICPEAAAVRDRDFPPMAPSRTPSPAHRRRLRFLTIAADCLGFLLAAALVAFAVYTLLTPH